MNIPNPHDKTFRDIFSDENHARDLISTALPKKIIKYLRLETLKTENGNFIDESLKEVQSDLLFSLQTKSNKSIKIYLLFEHKSYIDKKIHRQILSYLARIYSGMDDLTLVIPIVFYHGKDKWTAFEDFHKMFDLSKKEMRLFGRYLPNFSYQLFDLNKTNIESIIFSLTLRAILYTFKNIWNLEDVQKLDELFNLSRDLLDENSGLELIRKLLLYIYGAKEIEPEILFDRVERIAPGKGDIVMTTAQKLMEKGEQKGKTEGLRQGIKEGKHDAARGMLSKGYPLEDIAEITGLSEEEIRRL